MAISRGIIVSHGDGLENLLGITCIVALFAAKRYLIPRAELYRSMDDEEPIPHHHHRGHRRNKHKHEDKVEEKSEA